MAPSGLREQAERTRISNLDEVTLYLSSLESVRFVPVRECRFLRPTVVGDQKRA